MQGAEMVEIALEPTNEIALERWGKVEFGLPEDSPLEDSAAGASQGSRSQMA